MNVKKTGNFWQPSQLKENWYLLAGLKSGISLISKIQIIFFLVILYLLCKISSPAILLSPFARFSFYRQRQQRGMILAS